MVSFSERSRYDKVHLITDLSICYYVLGIMIVVGDSEMNKLWCLSSRISQSYQGGVQKISM